MSATASPVQPSLVELIEQNRRHTAQLRVVLEHPNHDAVRNHLRGTGEEAKGSGWTRRGEAELQCGSLRLKAACLPSCPALSSLAISSRLVAIRRTAEHLLLPASPAPYRQPTLPRPCVRACLPLTSMRVLGPTLVSSRTLYPTVSPTASPSIAAILRAADFAATLLGSRTRIFPPFHGLPPDPFPLLLLLLGPEEEEEEGSVER